MLETGIITGGFGLAALIALLAGVLSFLSPCVLPLVPPYLCFITGTSLDELSQRDAAASDARGRAMLAALLFGFLFQGGAELGLWTKIPIELRTVVQGLVILFTGALDQMVRMMLGVFFRPRKAVA